MVKFGRHVDFFVANELDSSRQLYVVPYKEIRERCIEIPKPPSPQKQSSSSTGGVTPLTSPPASRQPSRQATPQPQRPSLAASGGGGASGLSALFDAPGTPGAAVAAAVAVETSPKPIRPKAILAKPAEDSVKTAAVTLNAGTGDELAAAVKSLLIHQRKQQSQQNAPISIPDDYGYDDPCNDDATLEHHGAKEVVAVFKEEDLEAQAHFMAGRFRTEWRICLKRASVDFDRAMQLFWTEVFEGVTCQHNPQSGQTHLDEGKEEKDDKDDAIRGALPDAALKMYVTAVPHERAQETFSFLKDIHSTALINAEALRKLVKKFDKMHYKGDKYSILLSGKLLPEVYSSNFTGSLASLEAGLALLRVLLQMDEDDDKSIISETEEEHQNPNAIREETRRLKKLANMDDDMRDVAVLSGGYFGNKKDVDAELVDRRKKELQWLRKMIEGIDPVYIPFLVAHRGFHSIHDRSDVRPLENSLMAYEAAWTNGCHLCECDIALTKDERIILAHDENFFRLGMDPTSPLCNRTVRDLTFKELMNCPLKSGARPPLLFDVLRSAAAIGGDAKMIVEIKAGNTEAGPALARMFLRHPQLMEHVAVIMSFDAFIMHSLRREMAAVYDRLHSTQQLEQLVPPAVSAPMRKPHDNDAGHPLKAPVLSNIALGSTLSSSPGLPVPPVISHGRAPSLNRYPSMLGGHNRLDSRDMFGLGYPLIDPKSDSVGYGLNLAEIDNTTSQSSTFLPIQKSQNDMFQRTFEEKEGEEKYNDPVVMPDNQVKSFPKLLLITVAETPKADYELFVDITKPEKVGELDGWLRGGDGGTLDGIYMQYQKVMMTPKGSKAMRNLASRYDVGIWGANPVPDDWDTFHRLVTECHVSYVNTSLPKHFRRKMKRSMSANTLAMNGILATHSMEMD